MICIFHFVTSETFWVALGSIAAIGTVWWTGRQIRLSRLTSSADLILRLEDRFENNEFVEKRKSAVRAMKNTIRANQGDIEAIFDFFETVGILVRKGSLDEELVWSSFFYWLHGYYRFGAEFIEEQRKSFPSRYEEVTWLHEKLLKIESSKRPSVDSEWDMFLEEEGQTIFSPAQVVKRSPSV